MILEIVDHLASINGVCMIFIGVQCDTGSFFAGMEQSQAVGVACSKHTIGAAVHIFHPFGLGRKIAIFALYDAHSIYPQIAKA